MEQKIREHMDYIFQAAPRTARAVELKEELIANLTDRYHDLIQQGESEEAAYSIVIAGIGDVEELIHGLREHEVFDPIGIQSQRQKSAVLVALAVGLFIASLIFPLIFEEFLFFLNIGFIGFILMILCWAFGVSLLVYNGMSKPKYVKMEETIVEDFKEWKTEKSKKKSLYNMVQTLVWAVTVPLYLCLGVFLNAWHPGWLVFILAPLVNTIIRLVFLYNEEES